MEQTIEVPRPILIGILTIATVCIFLWGVQRVIDWWERRDARLEQERIESEKFRYAPLLGEIDAVYARMGELEKENHSLRDEVCRLITRTIQMSNELRSDDSAKTQVLTQTSSGRFAKVPI